MPLLSLTASHRELDLDALDRLSVGAGVIASIARAECRAVVGAIVLATCNRFELYLDLDAPVPAFGAASSGLDHACAHVAALVASTSSVPVDATLAALRIRSGPDVAEHLFAVAAGLDSMVVGEREIAGQVKRSLAAAREAGTTSPTLELLFQTASRTSKRVASHTELGATGRSLVGIGLELAARDLPPWPKARALVLGTGSYAGATIAALRSTGCREVRVFSASGRAVTFARDRGVTPVADLGHALLDADLVVACSGTSTAYLLDAASIPQAARPLVILDLALHRDVDPAVVGEGVTLLDLAALAGHAPIAASDARAEAAAIVDDAAREFERTRLGRAADGAVVALLGEAEERITAEVAWRLATAADRGSAPEADPARAEVIAREVRRRIHAELHPRILEIRAAAVARVDEPRRRAGEPRRSLRA